MPHDPVQGRDHGRGVSTLDLETLPRDVRSAVEAMVAGDELTLRVAGREVGTLSFRPDVLEGAVVAGPPVVPTDPVPTEGVSDGVTVVATATRMSDAARQRLSDELGPGYIVLDLLQAPTTADVVLTHPVSPQLLGSLRAGFPDARILVTEIDDEELGVSQLGPVSRLLDAGASAYLPPRALHEVASGVHAYLTGSGAPQLTAGAPAPAPRAALPSSPSRRSR